MPSFSAGLSPPFTRVVAQRPVGVGPRSQPPPALSRQLRGRLCSEIVWLCGGLLARLPHTAAERKAQRKNQARSRPFAADSCERRHDGFAWFLRGLVNALTCLCADCRLRALSWLPRLIRGEQGEPDGAFGTGLAPRVRPFLHTNK